MLILMQVHKVIDRLIYCVYNNSAHNTLRLEWDENKREENIRKHGIDLNCAMDVLTDKNIVIYEDVRKKYGETRYIAYGMHRTNVLCACYTMRGNVYRVISLRKTHKKERKIRYDSH